MLTKSITAGVALATLIIGSATALSLATTDRRADHGTTFKSAQALSYVLGSKRAIGYFEQVRGECRLTLMVAEAIDPDLATPASAARLSVAMQPGQQLDLGSEEGEAMRVTCGSGAQTVSVDRSSLARM